MEATTLLKSSRRTGAVEIDVGTVDGSRVDEEEEEEEGCALICVS